VNNTTTQKTITTLIVDDEDLARKKIRRFVSDDEAFRVIGECENGFQAVESALEQMPDVLFLDVQMPEMDGFEALRMIRSSLKTLQANTESPVTMPFVVFITAYDHYALEAFREHAADYLLKPFDYKRFQAMLTHLKEQIANTQARAENKRLVELLAERDAEHFPSSHYSDHFVFRTRGRVYFVKAEDVEWIEADKNYVLVHVQSGFTTAPNQEAVHVLRETLAELEARLNPEYFVRVHRSAIVRISCIASIQRRTERDYDVLLYDGNRIECGRKYVKKIAEVIGKG
jgi:two-component system, LytTR family, response regulator